ncbi:MAG TPA: hypothetical protein VGT44_12715 [Ktedonobacteraceae bacterium]|nr:hypothetical protein [Ktedonobacteraceae bacterium]
MLRGVVRDAVRSPAMAVLVEIGCSVSQAESAQTAIEGLCKETGSLLVGRRNNKWTRKVLYIVQFPHLESARKLMAALRQSRQHGVIESFRYMPGDLVHISFHPPVNLQEQMRDFPLRPEESWFPAIHHPHQVYVSLSMPVMLAKQAAWLVAHEVEWSFV